MKCPTIIVNKSIGKQLNYPQIRAVRLPHDIDGDGISNNIDCQPNNIFRQDNYIDLNNPEYVNRSRYQNNPNTYGNVTKIPGKKVGAGITMAGAAIPIIFPLPVAAAIGGYVSKKVNSVNLVHTDEHDNKYKVPRIEFN